MNSDGKEPKNFILRNKQLAAKVKASKETPKPAKIKVVKKGSPEKTPERTEDVKDVKI